MNERIFPSFAPGTKIGVVSPSSWALPAYVDTIKALWEPRGVQVIAHKQNDERTGLLAGSHESRAAALMEVATDPQIGAVMFTRGVTGSVHLLDRLDYDTIRQNPKPYIGSSDATPLLHAITKKSGLTTFYGPMGITFTIPGLNPRTADDLFTAIECGPEGYTLSYERLSSGVECVTQGTATGRLIGGHINRMQLLAGTPYDLWSSESEKEDIILFFETIDTTRLEIDNVLTQFRLAGRFASIRGVIIGEILRIYDGETSLARDGERLYGRNESEIIEEHIKSMAPGIPVVRNFPCGHGKYLTTLPIGSAVRMTVMTNETQLSFGRAARLTP